MKIRTIPTFGSLIAALFLLQTICHAEEKAPLKKEKLQIVFCLGQSNMVGLTEILDSPENKFTVSDTFARKLAKHMPK